MNWTLLLFRSKVKITLTNKVTRTQHTTYTHIIEVDVHKEFFVGLFCNAGCHSELLLFFYYVQCNLVYAFPQDLLEPTTQRRSPTLSNGSRTPSSRGLVCDTAPFCWCWLHHFGQIITDFVPKCHIDITFLFFEFHRAWVPFWEQLASPRRLGLCESAIRPFSRYWIFVFQLYLNACGHC